MTIPASAIAKINPGVVNAGGAGLVLNALYLTENLAMPTGQVLSFSSQAAVGAFFGLASAEYAQAGIYFAGYANSTLSPSAILFAAYNAAARAAFLVTGAFTNLAQVTAIAPGILDLTVDGVALVSSSINLSGAASFTAAAILIAAAFTDGPTVSWNPITSSFVFESTTTGASSTISFGSGAIAAALLTTQATGAALSQGAIADTPTSAMNNAVAQSQNWASMVTMFEPDLATKELFAIWFTEQDDAYAWLAWDSDTQASVQNASEPFGVVAKAAKYDGVACIGGDPAILTYIPPGSSSPLIPAGTTLAQIVQNIASFVAGAIASINFGQTNGRTALAFLQQSGMFPSCANQQTASNLLANGYSFYGAYATRNQNFTFFYNGNMPGAFPWIDTFIDDIWMNDQFQVTLLTLLTSIGSAAYNPNGYGLIRTALLGGPIAAALNFGAIRTGVVLSSTQIAEVNQAAGGNVAPLISTQGYYLQILDPGAVIRQERGTPILNFWYTDGGSIQQLAMNSDDLL